MTLLLIPLCPLLAALCALLPLRGRTAAAATIVAALAAAAGAGARRCAARRSADRGRAGMDRRRRPERARFSCSWPP